MLSSSPAQVTPSSGNGVHRAPTPHNQELFGWVRHGRLRVHISGRYALGDAAQAHRDMETRRTTGKLLLHLSR
jgi:NADPH:quinone reductase-like Zn-dependent oxidoreductase